MSTQRSRRLFRAALATLCLAVVPGRASAADRDAAAALFAEAGRLVDDNQPERACPKYEQSLRLWDSDNTRYFLADCYERVGRTASALILFREIAARSRASGDPVKESKALERASAVEPRAPRLELRVLEPRAPGLRVTRDGAVVDRSEWGAAILVDPGRHVFEASAPGKQSFFAEVILGPGSNRVEIPALADGAIASRGPSRRAVAAIVGGTGVLTAGAGTMLGVLARSRFEESAPHCNGDRCDATGIAIRESAVDRAGVATVVFGLGVAAIVAGGVLWFSAPDEPARAALGLSPGPGGVILHGRL